MGEYVYVCGRAGNVSEPNSEWKKEIFRPVCFVNNVNKYRTQKTVFPGTAMSRVYSTVFYIHFH